MDDDPDIREAMVEVLSDEGYEVTAVANGHEALTYLRSVTPPKRPCLILLDLMMPVMNGWEFRQEQLADTALAAIPVIAITAGGVAASSVPVPVLLPKPLDVERLLDVLREHC